MKKVYIYGAHVRASTLKTYLKLVIPGMDILGFIVEDVDKNPIEIDGISVYCIKDVCINTDCAVIVATKMKYHKHIKELLEPLFSDRIIYLTPDMDNRIKRAYFKIRFELEGREVCYADELSLDELQKLGKGAANEFSIYEVVSIYDSIIEQKSSKKDNDINMIRIQAGAALTDRVIAQVRDDAGDNISAKNRSYCELTAAYWLWKHEKSVYVGLCHYRRHFVIDEMMLKAVRQADIDVVLPVPTGCEPSVRDNYNERHNGEDWNIMMQLLNNKYHEYYLTALDVFENNYYYACNMWIMKNNVLSEYAEWLFAILEQLESKCEVREDVYQRRYIGFLSERLTTLYFIHNEKQLKMAFADKIYLT